MGLLPMNESLMSCINLLENMGSLTRVGLPDADPFHDTSHIC